MALSYQSVPLRTAMVDVISSALDGGNIQFWDASKELGTCTFSSDAFAAASNGSITANSIGNESSANAGTVTQAKFYNSSNVLQFTALAGEAETNDMQFNRATLEDEDLISVTSLTYTAPS
ncbi:MAG: hypothetical protein KZQ59_12175 [Candidatus Thiodiazotropha sp. (ex Lucinoma aequizonata)]|nr:hypothetical protein [Candidatus Thiodiazotropha sp. (ex Lucinoma aequizonata)]